MTARSVPAGRARLATSHECGIRVTDAMARENTGTPEQRAGQITDRGTDLRHHTGRTDMPEEMRGQWPGGWKEDAHGNLAFAIREGGHHDGELAPVWACPLCRTAQLHTEAEHTKILGLAAKR